MAKPKTSVAPTPEATTSSLQPMDYTLPANLGLRIADRLWQELGCSPLGRPTRRYLTAGEVTSDECDALTVAFRGMTPVGLGRPDLNANGSWSRCRNETQWLARYEARLLRSCWPTLTPTGRPPHETVIEEAAVKLVMDGSLLAAWLDTLLSDPETTFAGLDTPDTWALTELSATIGELTELGPLGGQAGWAIQYAILIPQECVTACLTPIPAPPEYLACPDEPNLADCDPLETIPTGPIAPAPPVTIPRAPTPPWRQ